MVSWSKIHSYWYLSHKHFHKDHYQAFSFFLIFKINLFIVFIYFWLRWVFTAARGLSLVAESRGYSSWQCACFSLQWLLFLQGLLFLQWLLLLRSTGSRRVGFSSCDSWALEHRLSSCGARALLLRSMWDLPGPGLQPVSPALAGGFLTTAPPGKSLPGFLDMAFRELSAWQP